MNNELGEVRYSLIPDEILDNMLLLEKLREGTVKNFKGKMISFLDDLTDKEYSIWCNCNIKGDTK